MCPETDFYWNIYIYIDMYVKPQRPQPGRATRPQPATYSCSSTRKLAMQAVQPAGPACILQARALVCRREHGMHAKI